MSTCEICGVKLAAGSTEGYKMHLKKFHNAHPQALEYDWITQRARPIILQPIKPERTTNRSKDHIVHDVEKTWGFALTPDVKPWHSFGDSTKGAI